MAPHETPSEPVSSSAQARTHLLSVPLFPHNTGTTPPGRPSPSPSPSPTPSQPWWEGDDAEPRSPLDQADHAPKLRNRRSAMSLFSLFSQPKVERAHGYAEQGIDPPSSRRARDPAGSHHHRGGHASPVAHVSRKRVPHETLPLFHAFARATKYGVLPVATTSAETALQKPRSRSTAGSQSSIGEAFPQLTAHDPGSGADNRRAAKTATTTTTTTTTTKHSANRSVSHADEFPSKMFVLINSGYLLQYREDGPSNRLPEKVLELGEESAAFACDLIPGRHHVLQVSRAVDSQGVMLAPTSTLWSKLRFRNTADKLPASRFLLVMPNAKEMEKWMAALRKEIEVVRGKGARADAEIGLWTEEATRREKLNKLKKQPSQSHRSRGRRKSSIAALPENAKGSDRRLSRLHDEEQEQQQEEEEEEKKQSNDDNNKKAEKATLDRIEKQADKLAEGAPPSLHRNELEHDAQSRSSSIAFSEQRKRSSSSIHESRRMSHATVATTIAPSSRANSMTGSAQSEYSNRGSSEATREDMPTKSPYRVLASYTASRRRSVMPMSTPRDNALPPQDPYTIHATSVRPETQILAPSSSSSSSSQPARDRRLPPRPLSPRQQVGAATSEPNLRNAASTRPRQDSFTPPAAPALKEAGRLESVGGELPSTSHCRSTRPSTQHASTFRAAASNDPQRALRTADPSQPRRPLGAKSFSLPLRVNPPNYNWQPRRSGLCPCSPVDTKARQLRAGDDPASEPPPPRKLPGPPPTSLQPFLPTNAGNNPQQPSRVPAGRLSLFPSTSPALPPPGPPLAPSNSPHPSSPHSIPPGGASGNPRALRRPTSMQVRSNPAPFLQSMRPGGSDSPPPLPPPPAASTFATSRSCPAPRPIRSLQPSRSATNLSFPQPPPPPPHLLARPAAAAAAAAVPQASPRTLRYESADQPTPLPSTSTRYPSPFPRPSSSASASASPSHPATAAAARPPTRRTSSLPPTTTRRRLKSRSSSSSSSASSYHPLDLAPLPVVLTNLGPPPAPAPSAPLPAPPTPATATATATATSRPSTPLVARPRSALEHSFAAARVRV